MPVDQEPREYKPLPGWLNNDLMPGKMVSYGLCSISREEEHGSIRHYSLTKTQSRRLEKVPIVKEAERTITKEGPQSFGELPQGFNPFKEGYWCPPYETPVDAYDAEEANKRAIRQSKKEEEPQEVDLTDFVSEGEMTVLRQIYAARKPLKLSELTGYEEHRDFKDTSLGKTIHALFCRELITGTQIVIPIGRKEPNLIEELCVPGVSMTKEQRRRFATVQVQEPKKIYSSEQERQTARRRQTAAASKRYRDKHHHPS